MILLPAMLALAMQFGADDEMVRGAASVGNELSAELAFRHEGHVTGNFAIGAALQAWINADVAVDRLAHRPANDASNVAALAQACSYEEAAFQTLGNYSGSGNPSVFVMRAGLPSRFASNWYRRRRGIPAACRRKD